MLSRPFVLQLREAQLRVWQSCTGFREDWRHWQSSISDKKNLILTEEYLDSAGLLIFDLY